MMTRATVEGVRVTVEAYRDGAGNQRWRWFGGIGDIPLEDEGGGYRSLQACVDAVHRSCGRDVPITHHSADAAPRADRGHRNVHAVLRLIAARVEQEGVA